MQNFLIPDTETIGLPVNFNAPVSDTRNWPRIVQLGWMLTDSEGTELETANHIIRPDGFRIPPDMIHGISHELALKKGKPLSQVLRLFSRALAQADCIVIHNYDFDAPILECEYHRLGIPCDISGKTAYCTQKQSAQFAPIPKMKSHPEGDRRNGWRSLRELHNFCFGCDVPGAHDALCDVRATKDCFFFVRGQYPGSFSEPYFLLTGITAPVPSASLRCGATGFGNRKI